MRGYATQFLLPKSLLANPKLNDNAIPDFGNPSAAPTANHTFLLCHFILHNAGKAYSNHFWLFKSSFAMLALKKALPSLELRSSGRFLLLIGLLGF
jgi:hypothetical protein